MSSIYQLKIELKGSNPKVWRRIQVSGNTAFSELHDIIQLSMGWENDNVYDFTIKNVKIYDFEDRFDDGSDPSERDSMDTLLDELVQKANTKFTYVYDFEDHWEHEILVEKILPEEKDNTYPVCLEGEGACPPEDCGGIGRYQNILKILKDKNHPEYNNITEWMDEDWDPEHFDRERTNVLLKDYMDQWEEIYEETGKIIKNLEEGDDYYLDEDFYDEDDEDEDDEDYKSN